MAHRLRGGINRIIALFAVMVTGQMVVLVAPIARQRHALVVTLPKQYPHLGHQIVFTHVNTATIPLTTRRVARLVPEEVGKRTCVPML